MRELFDKQGPLKLSHLEVLEGKDPEEIRGEKMEKILKLVETSSFYHLEEGNIAGEVLNARYRSEGLLMLITLPVDYIKFRKMGFPRRLYLEKIITDEK